MAYKIGEEAHIHMKFSETLHDLHNIIADDEISNRKYSEEDKIIVRNMMLNGNVIGGLVTEDHRKDWVNMSMEEMYDQVCAEIEEIQEKLRYGWTASDITREKPNDLIRNSILNTYIYSDTISDSMISGTLHSFIERGCTIDGKKWKEDFRNIAINIFDELSGDTLDEDYLQELLSKIATSSPVEVIDLFDNNHVKLYTPEEKYVAVEVLKKFKSEYTEWYDKVASSLEDLSVEELRELLDTLK